MFIASKLLAFALEPLLWVLALLLTGVLLGRLRPRLGRAFCGAALLALLASGWLYIPELLIEDLELRHPRPAAIDLGAYAGVVVLGGALAHSGIWSRFGQVALNEQAERMTEAVSLSQRFPHLKLVFTGGIATVSGTGWTEARRARMFFDAMGVDPARVVYEDASRNTSENALYSANLPGVDTQKPWLLLTSAFHMPRAMGVFTHAGWNVTPWPVDYRSSNGISWTDFSLHYGPRTWSLALHEWIGALAYRMAGRM